MPVIHLLYTGVQTLEHASVQTIMYANIQTLLYVTTFLYGYVI